MTLEEVIKSGLPFKRPNDKFYWSVNKTTGQIVEHDCPEEGYPYILPSIVENILAIDWET